MTNLLPGWDFTEGKIVLAFAIMALVAIGWRHLVGEAQEAAPWLDKAVSLLGIASTSRGSPHWAWVDRAVAIMGVAILVAVIVKWVDLSGLAAESEGELSIGAGIFLGLVGSLMLIASAVPSIVELIDAARVPGMMPKLPPRRRPRVRPRLGLSPTR